MNDTLTPDQSNQSEHPEFVKNVNNLVDYLTVEAKRHKELLTLVSSLIKNLNNLNRVLTSPVLSEVEDKIAHSMQNAFKQVEQVAEEEIKKDVKKFWK